jgi:hypothetical protein
MIMDSDEMRIFDQALYRLIVRSEMASKHITPREIARRMVIAQAAKVYDPDEFDRLVLADDFSTFEVDTFMNTDRGDLRDLVWTLLRSSGKGENQVLALG